MINQTYFHKMTVLRNETTEDEWGGVISGYHEVTGLISIPCAFSQSSRNVNTSQTESTNEININPKIFCNPDLDIRVGDRIQVYWKTRYLGTFNASNPYIYNSHQEIPISRVGEA